MGSQTEPCRCGSCHIAVRGGQQEERQLCKNTVADKGLAVKEAERGRLVPGPGCGTSVADFPRHLRG